MIAIKLSGALMILVSAAATGYMMGERARKQLKLLEALRHWLTVFRAEVYYSQTTLGEIFEMLAERKEDMWNEFFVSIYKEVGSTYIEKNMPHIWEESFASSGIGKLMTEQDKKDFVRFGSELGCYDKDSQIGRIDLYMSSVENRISELDKEIFEKVRLCRLLGIAGGAFITILIV